MCPMRSSTAGDVDGAKSIGIPMDMFAMRPAGPLDAATQAMIQRLVEKGALVQAINEAWGLVAVVTFVALLCVPFAKPAAVKNGVTI